MSSGTVLLMGNPNVGKSTVFNGLTGLRQHTGNWPGKTVETARGRIRSRGETLTLVDLPGLYSMDVRSREEQVAREALEGGEFRWVAVVCDGTMLERNLILVYQLLARKVPVVVCVNLLDEAARRGISIDLQKLQDCLGVPVVGCAAARGRGLGDLKRLLLREPEPPQPREIPQDRTRRAILARTTARAVTSGTGGDPVSRWDRLLVGKYTAFPVMALLLLGLLWLTIAGANLPSELLWRGVLRCHGYLTDLLSPLPEALRGALLDGMLLTAGRVAAVMLPPMAIFFPLFTLLEDLGALPRMAYNLDRCLQGCGACGKTALTYCMSLGCNAAGVTGCRIIESPRERLLAILTQSFIPCNGRFGGLILLAGLCLSPALGSLGAACWVLGFLMLGTAGAMGVSFLLSRTVLRGMPSAFQMELPPFRVPRVGQVLIRSVLDRTLRVLSRALLAAAPAGLLLWGLQHAAVGGRSLLALLTGLLDPAGRLLGMNGTLMAAFLLGFPANEIVLPVAVLAATGAGGLETGAAALGGLGLDRVSALCTAVFFLLHWPCATTCLTIRKETGSVKWTLAAMLLPTLPGAAVCMGIRWIGGVF